MTQDHYFTRRAATEVRLETLEVRWHGRSLSWCTSAGVFGARGLDPGTALLLDSLPDDTGDLLDLGCGTGFVGLLPRLAGRPGRSFLVDVAWPACVAAAANARRHGLTSAVIVQGDSYDPWRRSFDIIATNPPIRAGRAVVARFLEQAPGHLVPGGAFYMVGRVQQGIRTLARILEASFGRSPEEVARSQGYRVLRIER